MLRKKSIRKGSTTIRKNFGKNLLLMVLSGIVLGNTITDG